MKKSTKRKHMPRSKIQKGKIKCPTCKEIIEEGLIFCPECGNRIPEFLRYNPV